MAEEISIAQSKRLEAARARRLAHSLTNADAVAALIKYAEECENEAVLLERQLAELHEFVGRSHKIAGEIAELADEAHRQLNELARQLNNSPARLPHTESFVCLDCARVTRRSQPMGYECPVCGSLESIVAEDGEDERK